MALPEALTFEDVLLRPGWSTTPPHEASVRTRLTPRIELNAPLLSAAMDTVSEHKMAIAMAQLGGIGVIHKNLSIEQQASEVEAVKRFESGMIVNPITIAPGNTLEDALNLMQQHNISGIPVVTKRSRRVVGILTHRDVRFARDKSTPVRSLMTSRNLVTVNKDCTQDEAMRLLHRHRIEKLLVTDAERRCIGLITVKDIERATAYPDAVKDRSGRLRVAAAVGVGGHEITRAEALIAAGCDVLVLDTAHGHSGPVIKQLRSLRSLSGTFDIIAGNIATADGAEALIKAGADAVKIGIGPGSICTTRVVAGVGVPQLSAVLEAAKICARHNRPAIADGGIRHSGDLAKAIAAGADCVMIGALLAGTDEAPGDVIFYQGRSYKSYRGMGSAGAMAQGSADRYGQDSVSEIQKFVPEGVEGRVPYKGSVSHVIHQLLGGLKAAMGYTGNASVQDMKTGCEFIRITHAGLRESHVHDVTVTREAPNYRLS